ncbi:Uncharacterised protein [Bordetella ansorpii]|uniref:Uncharacterized protein n=1 Tax=Bordetella ansorpii TaxID=288768 RepID=A0A157QNX0_9BORD|nr:Uncharacterised protein [Bordetella ansorpii]
MTEYAIPPIASHTSVQAPLEDRIIWRPDLQQKFDVSSNTVRRWILEGKLPPPDVDLSRKTKGWRLSTLLNAGIRLA